MLELRPQPGPQEAFLSSDADIAIYGGAAGAGKTFAMLLEPLRHVVGQPEFSAVFFRRNTTHIRNPGGLWDESLLMYPATGGVPSTHSLEWRWPKGGKIKMGHLEYEKTKLDWQGAQIPLILFDELTHFSMTQFFYLMSRNRSLCGVKPYIRCSTNPDADSWVASFISWWIDQETGFPIPERSGVVRWFVRINDEIIWGDSREELVERFRVQHLPLDHEEQPQPKSVTFIPGKLTDNPKLMKADPGYLANLKAMPRVEQGRLLGGNWKIRPAAGLYFKRHEVTMLRSIAPSDIVAMARRWDLAATEPTEENPNPDWTVGAKLALLKDGRTVVMDVRRAQIKSAKVRELVLNTAKADGVEVRIGIPQDPGQAGKDQYESYLALLRGYRVVKVLETGDKVTRAEPFAAQWQGGAVCYLEGPWNEAFLLEYEQFPEGAKDDQVDAGSGAFTMLSQRSAAPATGGARTH